ncbi:hypothetical protein [Thermomonospora umbrina]|uniref:hypothetical protein n=1 Tax=Thermomonospora umbrina TaxID=111806 RepID=UPI001B86FF8C|nr:hypothetical protein [Thermomonospora umbrina]
MYLRSEVDPTFGRGSGGRLREVPGAISGSGGRGNRIGKTAERHGEARPPASVADEEIGEALELLRGGAAVNTRRASVGSWLARCRMRGHEAPAVPPGPNGRPSPIRRLRPAPGWRSTG